LAQIQLQGVFLYRGIFLKRILLLLDGTWNDADVGVSDTNIVRLRENIASCLDPISSLPATTTPASGANQTSISFRTHTSGGQTIPYVVFYERGVGTSGFFDDIRGGAFGSGLSRNVRRAYRFVSHYYEPGDEIFIFGFSRGSYTARSLVGYISTAGLLQSANCNAVNESRGWYYYRTSPLDRPPADSEEVRRYAHKDSDVRIRFLGVFDTVGALGIPIAWFKRENRDLFEFHDVGLSAKCDVSVQALAIDEHREAFEATLWRKPKFDQINVPAEQVWFVGAHSDVGGGYIDERTRTSTSPQTLDDITLDWMIKRLLRHCEDFPLHQSYPNWPIQLESYLAPQHEARRQIFSARPFAYRSIGNCYGMSQRRRWEVDVCYDRHNIAIGENIHISAILRLGRPVSGAKGQYVPANLIAALARAEDNLKNPLAADRLGIVSWSGDLADRDEAAEAITDARRRLQILGIDPSLG
jgi:Uncharacterized alpha/beta hydrolase domain (DUF2235)